MSRPTLKSQPPENVDIHFYFFFFFFFVEMWLPPIGGQVRRLGLGLDLGLGLGSGLCVLV